MTNKQIVQKMLLAYQEKDLDTILSLISGQAIWKTQGDPKSIPFAGTLNGRQEIAQRFALQAKIIEPRVFTPRGLIGGDDEPTQIFLAYEEVLVRDTGRIYKTDFALVISLENGQVIRIETLMDTQAVARAFQGTP